MNPPPSPPDPNRVAAHEFLSELRTRISTQPLPYQFGVESRALESLWEVFGQAREAMKKHPGCEAFARVTTDTLNVTLRPFTAKWHRAHADGRLNSRDGADEFRGELKRVQEALRAFARELHEMAYGHAGTDQLTRPAISEAELLHCFEPLRVGIRPNAVLEDHEAIRKLNESEHAEILKRRKHRGLPEGDLHNGVGLALSGGGIRSATFCLGIAQVLAERGLLDQVDYLSTVSGGGYTGSFLTRRLGESNDASALALVARPQGPDPEPVRYLRHHAEFLSPASVWDSWSMITATLAGMLLNWSVPFFVIALAALGISLIAPAFNPNLWPVLVGGSAGLTVVGLVLYAALLQGSSQSMRRGAWILGGTTALTVGLALGWLIHYGYRALPELISNHWAVTGGFGAIIAAAPFVIRFIPAINTPVIRRIAVKVLMLIGGLVIPVIGILFFYLCRFIAEMGPIPKGISPTFPVDGRWILAGLAAVLGLVALFLLNINLTAPHRLYRNRLARTFVQRSEKEEDDVPLKDINATGRAPYHLINTTLNLPHSEYPYLRDRRCDFFLFSKHWCGSPAAGYELTAKWRTNHAPVDLATVMAVSGAAASAHMGLLSIPTLTALLTALNVRLGFWIRHPNRPGLDNKPGFLCLLREMTGFGMTEEANWLNLSDGGHIENTAAYELLRRRCKFIVCVDGEADPTFRFPGLMTLVRHARIDFGIRIEPGLDELRPDPKTGFSQSHAILCRIHYPEAPETPGAEPTPALGLLLYIKLSVTGNESELIRRYRLICPTFPHQSTADQFFNQEQFEAYRQLGVHAAEGLFGEALMNSNTLVTEAAQIGPRCRPGTVDQWFRQLAESLLVPSQEFQAEP